MPLRLWQRLFVAFAAISILALAAFAALQALRFQQDFLGYVNRLEHERIELAAPALADAYRRHGDDWRFLRGDTGRLLRVLQLGAPGGASMRGRADALPGDASDAIPLGPDRPPRGQRRPDRPWPEGGPPEATLPAPGPPPSDGAGPPPFPPDAFGPPPPDDAGLPADARRGARRPPPRGALGLNVRPRLLLLDAGDAIVAGNPGVPRDAPAIDIVSDGRVVGRLLLAPLPKLREDLDVDFARDQRRHMTWLAASVLLVALLLALAVSRWLLRPVHALARGARALSAGDYATRIAVERDDEFGALARDFNALASTLDSHREARRQWGADIAHELRTPISVLSGEIQALQDGVRQVDAARLASLQAECQRLRDLVEDLYQLALSDAGALSYRFAPVDVAALVEEAVQAHAPLMRAAGLDLSFAPGRHDGRLPGGDATRLRQLVDNLLANAARYTDAPGRVVVDLVREPLGLRLTVDDTPPGVDPASLPRLFERLYRAESSRSRRFGGAGLGLAICRNIVEAHGGTIEAVPSPLGGLRIDVFLPDTRG